MRSLWKSWKDKYDLGDLIILSGMLVFAYQFTYLCGQRGFFAFDQSIIFDGSYRIASGQVPFKDFLIPFGPMVFWLQGLIFKIIGVSYASYIFGAAIFNVAAALAGYLILRLLFPDQKAPAMLGAAITAIWFYPPFGTPWPEQTAFFFSLIALLGVLAGFEGQRRETKGARGLFFLAGVSTFAAFISKQNAGAFILPVISLIFLIDHLNSIRKGILDFVVFSLGWLGGLMAFGIWLFAQADLNLFLRHFIQIPADEVGAGRLPRGWLNWLQTIFIGSARPEIILLSIICSLTALGLIVYIFRGKPKKTPAPSTFFLAAVLAPSLFLYHNIFLITSNNQAENSLPFIGLIAGIGLGLVTEMNFKKSTRTLLAAGMVILSIWIAWLGVDVAYSRQVHSIFKNSSFPNHLATGKLSAIRWGDPTRIGNLIPAEDFDSLIEYLSTSGENFFVFPDFTILYGAVGVPSPQPLLWFHNGLTYPNEYDPALDDWVVSDLIENQVGIIVIEEQSWFLTAERLDDFPLLEKFITENYAIQEQIGIFIVYVHQDQ
jgi:hypothetical protein